MPINRINRARMLAARAFSGDETAVKAILDDHVISPTPTGVDPTDAKLKGFLEGVDYVLDCVRQAKQDRKLQALNIDISTDW